VTVTAPLRSRRAVEALRAGVPSRDAVAALGTGQSGIEDAFAAALSRTGSASGGSRGLLLGGGFGSGKTHLLEHLARLAQDEGFVVSLVVVSKETPLHDPAKVFRALADAATLPSGQPGAVAEAAASLDPGGPGYAEMLRWASAAELDERLPATLALLPRLHSADGEFTDAVVRFWAGDPLATTELRRRLRQHGEPRRSLRSVPARELGRQRVRFLARLFTAAGYAGWVVLLDEVELIGRYSLLQRAKAYAELARWLRVDPDDPACPVLPVVAMTDDFEAAVLTDKNDRELIPQRLRAKQSPEWDETAGLAEAGMRRITREMRLLSPPDDAELDRAYARVKALHGEAFGWVAPDVPGLERLGATRMRQYVRAWINEWDLVRLDPGYRPSTEAVFVSPTYADDPDLEE
jgi:hypothetical protein